MSEALNSKLVKIASITPGKTLSTSTMEILDSKSWYNSFLGDNPNHVVTFIKNILIEAIDFYKLEKSNDFLSLIESGFEGLKALSKTYPDDYYLIGGINKFMR